MGSNSARNLTYLLILGLLGGLVYLVKRKVDQSKAAASTLESTPSGLSTSPAISDTTYSLSTTANPSSMHFDSSHNSLDGKVVSGKPSSYNEKGVKSKGKHDALAANSMMDDNALSLADPLPAASTTATKVTSKGIHKKAVGTVVHSKGVKHTTVVKKDNASTTGDYNVVAGSFASSDNARALVVKLKKLGYTKAEAVRADNSTNTQVIAGKYKYKGGADAAVRTLKKDKIDAIVKKKTSVLLKAENVTSSGNQASF